MSNREYDEMLDEEIGTSEEAMYTPNKASKKTNKKGKTIALTILVVGGLVAGSILGTKAYYSNKETRRVDNLIANYQVDDYVVLPRSVVTDRAYDITYANGEKLVSRLESKEIQYININGQFYTPTGEDIAILTYEVVYTEQVDAIKVNNEGQEIYMAPNGYVLNGTHAIRSISEIHTKVVPVSDDYSYIHFTGASDWQMIDEPQIVSTLPYDVIQNSTLICDVPDNAELNDQNQCIGTLNLAPRKR